MKRPSLWQTAKADLRLVPGVLTALFCISVIIMNLLANKTIYQAGVIAADGGILISWLAFLCMDIVTKALGQRVAATLSVFALMTNLFVCVIFYLVSAIPTETDYTAFNMIFASTCFILLSSSVAFITSAFVNIALNAAIGRCFRKKPDGKAAYVTRSYISTFVDQFWDNFVFASLTFMVFAPVYWDGFRWTLPQCVTCSLIGAVLELIMEVIFSPIGYYVLRQWRKEGVCPPRKELKAA